MFLHVAHAHQTNTMLCMCTHAITHPHTVTHTHTHARTHTHTHTQKGKAVSHLVTFWSFFLEPASYLLQDLIKIQQCFSAMMIVCLKYPHVILASHSPERWVFSSMSNSKTRWTCVSLVLTGLVQCKLGHSGINNKNVPVMLSILVLA